jgi:isoleucyl-tRNA synthetase
VFAANKPIIQRLKQEGKLFRHDTYDHSYPHCWRTDEPLIYKAVDSWYLRVSQFRDRMVELNEQINWIPNHVKHGIFGNWLAAAQDWNISRSRFWGTPIPVWMSDDPTYPRVDVYGSIDELESDFGVKVTDLHRPFVDQLTRPNPDDPTGKSLMRRVEDVLDVWFDSGAMPFASVHYPFENQEWFEQNFPSDFIVEYIAQTRGWFYTLMVLGTMLFDAPPFRNAICHGVVLDANRKKLSKRLRNYPDPLDFFEQYGSDTMRWFLLSSTVLTGGDLMVPEEGRTIAASQREAIAPLMNAYNFFSLYANLEERVPQMIENGDDLLDRYILTKTGALAKSVANALEHYDIPGACRETTLYFDALNNWYIRRSRARFWGSTDVDSKNAAFDTLYTVLVKTCQILAPLLPILTEKLYKELTGKRSVHLSSWPDAEAFPQDFDLLRSMDLVREVCSAALSVRERYRLRVRLPLQKIIVVHPESNKLEAFATLIAAEVNVRKVEFSSRLDTHSSVELNVNPKIGKRLGSKLQEVIDAARAKKFTLTDDGKAIAAGETLTKDEFSLRVVGAEGNAVEPFGSSGTVVVDISIDKDQEIEGLARDLVRAVQDTRKEAGLEVSDRIRLWVNGTSNVMEALATHKNFICKETLTSELAARKPEREPVTVELQGESALIIVEKRQEL